MNRSLSFKQVRFRAIVAGVCSIVFAASLSAQVTSVRLPTADSSASFRVQDNAGAVKLRINGDGGLVIRGAYATGVIPATGAGARMMWYPADAAFRAGYVSGSQWDASYVGGYSTAMGSSTTASGYYSTAMGYYATASGNSSTAMGNSTTASGYYSTAMGCYVSTNSDSGAFIIGDNSTTTVTNSSAANQMTMRFANGYRFFTNSGATVGAQIVAGGNSWTTISDSTKKTNFIKADHDYFLSSLSKLKLGSWNYKAQNADAKNFRHYGPMAQEIFHYFGHDGKGAIGCDTLLASADMDGIMMICLQALEKRTGELQKANDKIAVLQSSYDGLKAEMQQMKNDIMLLAQAKSGTAANVAYNTRKGQ